jgi:hypothetical protein
MAAQSEEVMIAESMFEAINHQFKLKIVTKAKFSST